MYCSALWESDISCDYSEKNWPGRDNSSFSKYLNVLFLISSQKSYSYTCPINICNDSATDCQFFLCLQVVMTNVWQQYEKEIRMIWQQSRQQSSPMLRWKELLCPSFLPMMLLVLETINIHLLCTGCQEEHVGHNANWSPVVQWTRPYRWTCNNSEWADIPQQEWTF